MKSREEKNPPLSLEYSLTRDEIHKVLLTTSRRPGKVRMAVQTAILLVLAATSFAGYVLYDTERSGMSLRIGILCIVVLAAIWLIPMWYFWFEAGNIYKDIKRVKLDIYDDLFVFGGEYSCEIKINECEMSLIPEILIIRTGSDAVGVPKRVLSAEAWQNLSERCNAVQESGSITAG